MSVRRWVRRSLPLLCALALGGGARAVEVDSGVATRITPSGLAFAASLVSDLTLDVPELPLAFSSDALGCDYDVELYGYSGSAELGPLQLRAIDGSPDHLAASGTIERIVVHDVIIEAVSPDWYCPNYNEEDHDVIISTLTAYDVDFTMRLGWQGQGAGLTFEILDSSDVDLGAVQIETTPWYIPDSLLDDAVDWFSDAIEDKLLEAAAAVVQALLFDLPLAGVIWEFAYDARIASLSVEGGGLDGVVDAGVAFVGEASDCGGGTPDTSAGDGDPGALTGGAGDVQLSLTEAFVEALLGAAWAGGFLCGDLEHLDFSAAAPLLPVLQGEHGVRFVYELAEQPRVRLVDGALQLEVDALALQLWDSAGERLFDAELAVAADAAFALDEAREALTMELLWVDLEVRALDADGLLQGTTYTEQAFLDLLDSDVLLLLPDQLGAMAVAPLVFGVTGLHTDAVEGLSPSLGGRLQSLELRDGEAVAVLDATLDVDDTPPTVAITHGVDGTWSTTDIEIEYRGEDERGGPVAYSWQVDDGGWSMWSEDTRASFVLLTPGSHTFAVKARDAWWNESEPVVGSFELDLGAGADDPEDGGCACRTDTARRAGGLELAGLAMLAGWVARRRTGPPRARKG